MNRQDAWLAGRVKHVTLDLLVPELEPHTGLSLLKNNFFNFSENELSITNETIKNMGESHKNNVV